MSTGRKRRRRTWERERTCIREPRSRGVRVEGKGEEGNTHRKREASNQEDCWPMRHQASDDVVVVSRRSLTKSLLRVPVRPRSPGWTTKRSSFRPYRIHPSWSVFLIISFSAQWNTNLVKIASWIHEKIEEEGGCCCQPWGRVSFGLCGRTICFSRPTSSERPVSFRYIAWMSIILLSNRYGFHTVSHLSQQLRLEKRQMGINLRKSGNLLDTHCEARTWGSMIFFARDLIAWWTIQLDGSLGPCCYRFFGRTLQIIDALTRLWPFRKPRSKLFVNWNHFETRSPKDAV